MTTDDGLAAVYLDGDHEPVVWFERVGGGRGRVNLGYAYLAYWGTFVVVLWVVPGLLAAVGPKDER